MNPDCTFWNVRDYAGTFRDSVAVFSAQKLQASERKKRVYAGTVHAHSCRVYVQLQHEQIAEIYSANAFRLEYLLVFMHRS